MEPYTRNGGIIGKTMDFGATDSYAFYEGDRESGLTLTTTWPVGQISTAYGTVDTVFAATLIFPASPTDGLIWETGATGQGAWLGIRDSGTTLRLRGGDGAAAKTASDIDTAVLDITDFPKDGEAHTIVWDFTISTGTVRVFIDGVLKGTESATGGSFDTNNFAGVNIGTFLDTAVAITVGEFSNPCNLTNAGTGLRVYVSQLAAPTNKKNSGIWDLEAVLESRSAQILDIPTGNLVLHLDASDTSSYSGAGSTWNDISGNLNNGTLNGSPTFNANFFTFNGTSQDVTTTTSFTNPSPITIFTIFRTSSASGRKIIGFQRPQTGTGIDKYDKQLYVDTSGFLRFGINDGAIKMAISPSTVTDNTWRLAVATYGGEGTTMRLYLNGLSVATATASSAESYTGWWRVAGYSVQGWTGGANGYFPGDIAVAGAYHRALSPEEVTQIYNKYRNIYSL